MARKKTERRGLGSSDEAHSVGISRETQRGIDIAGQSTRSPSCNRSLTLLLAARGHTAAAVAHSRAGGRDEHGLLPLASETVSRAEKHFAARCLRK